MIGVLPEGLNIEDKMFIPIYKIEKIEVEGDYIVVYADTSTNTIKALYSDYGLQKPDKSIQNFQGQASDVYFEIIKKFGKL